VWELRDESLLKLFLSDDRDPAEVREDMRAARERSEGVAARLRAIAPEVAPEGIDDPDPGKLMVLRFGIEFNEWLADWWARAEERAARAEAAARG
jgi:hypothetical protein